MQVKSRTIITIDGEGGRVTVEAPGHFDEIVAGQLGAEMLLRWLAEGGVHLAIGAIPLQIRDQIETLGRVEK